MVLLKRIVIVGTVTLVILASQAAHARQATADVTQSRDRQIRLSLLRPDKGPESFDERGYAVPPGQVSALPVSVRTVRLRVGVKRVTGRIVRSTSGTRLVFDTRDGRVHHEFGGLKNTVHLTGRVNGHTLNVRLSN
jgi:hypothetical protein